MLDRPRSGRPTSVSTPQLKKKIASRITRNRRRSIRKMARDFSVCHESVRKVVRNGLGLKSLKRHTVHQLTPALRQKRFQRSKKLLVRLAVVLKITYYFQTRKFLQLRMHITPKMIVSSLHHLKASMMKKSSLIGCKNPIIDGMGRCDRQLSDTSKFCPPGGKN